MAISALVYINTRAVYRLYIALPRSRSTCSFLPGILIYTVSIKVDTKSRGDEQDRLI